jgi:alpha-L-rhamnosidase
MTGRLVASYLEPYSEFSCSNEKINKLHEVIKRTQLNNLHGIPTDCPQREKMGWLHDGCVTAETAIHNFHMPNFYTKWVGDILDAQDTNGHVPSIVPNPGWGRINQDGSPGYFSDPWWGGAIIYLPWKLSLYYKDIRILENGYNSMKSYFAYLHSQAPNHIVEWKGAPGDWLDNTSGRERNRLTPYRQTSTAAIYNYAWIMGKVADLLCRRKDSREFRKLAENIQFRYDKEMLNPKTGEYAKDSQTSQVLPLYFHIVPVDKNFLAVDQLLRDVKEARAGHIGTGIVGTLCLSYALSELGYCDLAYNILTQENYPGWFHMINSGATTLWEA